MNHAFLPGLRPTAMGLLALLGLNSPVAAQTGYRPLATWLDATAKGAPVPAPLAARIAFGTERVPLGHALDSLRARAGLALAYGDEVTGVRAERMPLDTLPVGQHLLRLLRGTGLTALADASGAVVVRRTAAPAPMPPREPATTERLRLTGYVRHQQTRDVVRYARLAVDGDSARAMSDADGRYTLFLAAGRHRIRVRAIGFVPTDTTIDLQASATADLLVAPATVQLTQIKVAAAPEAPDIDLRSPQMSVARLDLEVVKRAPAVLGEVDPIRSLTLLPGVSRTSDFTTAFSVRGGSGDQNLILLDQATIYNPAHLLGFLSVFNADAVADVTLYKGAIPSRFGGRLSSVVDVRQREGDASRLGGALSLGLLSSRASIEGPVPGLGGSFLVAARRSYADAFLRFSPDTAARRNAAYFYDVNAKWARSIGATGSLFVSGYAGRDRFAQRDVGTTWGNVSGTLRWNQFFANRLFHKFTLSSSDYDYDLGFPLLDTKARWTSRIATTEARLDEQWQFAERNRLEFGVEAAATLVRPGDLVAGDTARLQPVRVPARRLATAAAYLGHEVDLGDRWSLSYGVRYAGARRLGPQTLYRYVGDAAVVFDTTFGRYVPGRLRDSVRVGDGDRLADAGGLEPRVALRMGLGATSSLKASWARTRQFMLLATRTNSPSPLDVWEPFGPNLAPLSSDQYALGYAATFGDGAWEATAETYYRQLRNVVDFLEGQDVVLNPRLESSLIQGVGRAYGLELLLRRRAGRTTGWVSYTLGRSEQRFSPGPGRGINDGAWFATPTDKRHDLSVVVVRPLTARWTLGSTFGFASGLPTTVPISRYNVDGLLVAEYGPRNAGRLPAYHRLDLTLTRTTKKTELSLGVFNVYNRFNAQSLAFRQVRNDPQRTEAVQISIFGILPSFSYTIRF